MLNNNRKQYNMKNPADSSVKTAYPRSWSRKARKGYHEYIAENDD